ncbi:MAG: relaxase/mobilization nuclease domain-containing protein [Eggerthellaceae bacterium]|nr:relaxase/mobilization nuclease domain-containing protein [Eggerthellaceae bacterium]
MPLVKCINGHTGCAATERYLERGGRAIGHDFMNLDCMERDGGDTIGWAAEMDELRNLYGNGEPYRGKPAITYRHYIVSPDPADGIDLGRLRELSVAWAQRHFGDYQVAIVYHDDNEHRIPHAHIVVNNTNVETGRRLHVPQPKELNRDLQQMARERGLGYLADEHHLYDKKAKGSSCRTAQREFKGRAERRIEREGGYSWVADIRERARTARALSTDEASYRELLGVLGVELSLNSPNARRRDYLYAFADHPSRIVSGEKLGWPYGKGALEHEWLMLSPFREEKLREIAEHAILVKDLEELREMARAMATIKECHFTSIADIDWTIGHLEKQGQAVDSQNADDAPDKLEKIRHARRFAADYGILPAKEPKPVWTLWGHSGPSPTRWGDSSGSRSSSRSQERSVDRSRDDYAR